MLRQHLPLLLALLTALTACTHHPPTSHQLIVLGIDGMDPSFVERHWPDLPNLNRLRSQGAFSRLATTTPPQSPVAWSTFITGLDPSQHGIFDFVHRDPATMQPFLSTDRIEPPRLRISLGPYRLPLTPSRIVSLRTGDPFWRSLTAQHIPVTVIRIPSNYPPAPFGQALSGMGTPDLRGASSTFTFFTSDPDEVSRPVPGGLIRNVQLRNGRAILPLDGPPNTLRNDAAYASISLIADVDPTEPYARFSTGVSDLILGQGEWSAWVAADFPLIPHLASVSGIFRIYAKQLHPRLEVYVSPVNVDPLAPALPISHPAAFSRDLAREMGRRYYTLGIPEDTSALRQGIFDHREFLVQSHLVLSAERALFTNSLHHFTTGFLFFYFSAIDQNSHMLFGKYDADLLEIYREIDTSVGEARAQFPDARLMVMSDHGFAPFDRAVNLNSWLRDRGLLATSGAAIDWPHTRAYALGLNALYLNLAGREKQGIVHPGRESQTLIAALRQSLLAWRDPANGRPIVEALPSTNPTPANARIAPDLIVGYTRGYRASWQTGQGEVPAAELEDNNDAWIADHCIAASEVPGILFTSWKTNLRNPSLKDLAALITGLNW